MSAPVSVRSRLVMDSPRLSHPDAALYSPIWTNAVLNAHDFALALTAFILLVVWKAQPWIMVSATVAVGASLQLSF